MDGHLASVLGSQEEQLSVASHSIAKQQRQERSMDESEDMEEPLTRASASAPRSSTLEHAAVLAARLRLERDRAVANLAFCSIEKNIAVETLESELQDLRNGRDSLRHDLQEMVAKLIEGERAQQQLDELTGTLCQTESSYQQVKGRLVTAYAELDDLRSRLGDASHPESDTTASDHFPQCTCRASLDELRKENASLGDELDLIQQQHLGSGNLVLSLQRQLDEATAKLKQVENESILRQQHSADLQIQLDEQQTQTHNVQRLLDAERAAHEKVQRDSAEQTTILDTETKARQIAEKAHTEQTDMLDEERMAHQKTESARLENANMLDAETKLRQEAERNHIEHVETLQDTLQDTRVQLEGAVNRTLALQIHFEEQEMALIATRQERDASRARLADMERGILARITELSSLSSQHQSLQNEVDDLQIGLESLVLVHLEGRKARTMPTLSPHSLSPQGIPEIRDDLLSMNDSARVTVVLIEASKQISALKGYCNTLRQKNINLEAQLKQNEIDIQSNLVSLADYKLKLESLVEENTTLRTQASAVQAKYDRALEEAQTARNLVEATTVTSAELARSLDDLTITLTATQSELRDSLAIIVELEKEIHSTRESLRVAEEEGRNLVADFNMLSEELEHRQTEDETR